MVRIIGIVSGKGGAGKTVTTANLGAALYGLGKNVILVDADITTSNLGLQLGLYSFPATLEDVIVRNEELLHAIHIHPSGLRLIPAPLAPMHWDTPTSKLRKHLDKLDGVILVDCPPGLGKDALEAIELCDELLVVTNPEVTAVTDAMKVMQTVRKVAPKKEILGIVLNRARGKKYELTVKEIEHICESSVIGIVPEDENVKTSIAEKTPVVQQNPYAKSSLAYKRLGAKILGVKYQDPSFSALRHFLSLLR